MGIFSKIYRLINPKEFGEFSNKHLSEIDFNQIHDIHNILEVDDKYSAKPYVVLWVDKNLNYFRSYGTKNEIIKYFKISKKDFKITK